MPVPIWKTYTPPDIVYLESPPEEDDPGPGSPQGLVDGGGDHVAVLDGGRDHPGCHQAAVVRGVA